MVTSKQKPYLAQLIVELFGIHNGPLYANGEEYLANQIIVEYGGKIVAQTEMPKAVQPN